jgi:hypothetical protein
MPRRIVATRRGFPRQRQMDSGCLTTTALCPERMTLQRLHDEILRDCGLNCWGRSLFVGNGLNQIFRKSLGIAFRPSTDEHQ